MDLQTTVFHASNYPYKKPKVPYLAEWDDISLQYLGYFDGENDYGDNEGGNDDDDDEDDDDDDDDDDENDGDDFPTC